MAPSPGRARAAEPVAVRQAAADEHGVVGALTVEAYETLSGMPLGHYRATLLDVAGRAEDADILVAVEPGGRILGAVTYVPGPHSAAAEFADASAAGIRFLAVDPLARGRGIGCLLVTACVERAREAGRARLLLHTSHWMAAAIRLYERLGFVREPRLDWEPEPGVKLLGFAYQLRDPPAGPPDDAG